MLIVENRQLAGIPCLTLYDDRFTSAQLLLHYHGWTGDKGSAAAPDQSLAQLATAGMMVVAPDCYEHGERATDAWFRSRFNGWAFVCDAMEHTREEAGGLTDAALQLPGVAGDDLQVSGVSMGGLIAQMVVAEESRAVAMVSVVGRSSFYQADEWCREAQVGTWCDQWCASNAPSLHPQRYTRSPSLFVDGGLDTDCPASTNAETARLIREAGGRADQFVDDEAGHEFSAPMRRRFVDWVLEHRTA
jgi:dienelactone hydrolase